MKKRIGLTICLFFVLPAVLTAQTAVRIEELLETKAVNYGQAAQFILEAADVLGYTSRAEAFIYAQERQWLPKNAIASGEAKLAGVALLIMQSFDIKGGTMYFLFRNPHYAYRELVFQDIIQGRADPDMTVSGDLLLFLINRVLYHQEEGLL